MTPDQEELYRRGDFDPRYPHNFGWREVILTVAAFAIVVGLIIAT